MFSMVNLKNGVLTNLPFVCAATSFTLQRTFWLAAKRCSALLILILNV